MSNIPSKINRLKNQNQGKKTQVKETESEDEPDDEYSR